MTALHSWQTNLYKYLLPINFIPWDGFRSIKRSLASSDPHLRIEFPIIIGFWLIMTPIVFWFAFKIKRVVLEEGVLTVKGFVKEVQIPANDIEDVRESGFGRMKFLTMSLRSPSEFGHKVSFLPNRGIEEVRAVIKRGM